MPTERATTLRLIKNISFTDSYDDVILFNSASQQYSYFAGLTGKNYSEYSYQRPEAGYVKLNTPFDEIHDYAYLMFRNTSHQDKWWYAFIDSVEYINEKTTGVRFHVDVMQSYMFNYTLGESFVVREHPVTDEPGDNIVPESIYYGDYDFTGDAFDKLEVDADECAFGFSGTLTPEDMCIVVAYNPSIIDLVSVANANFDYVWKENLYGGVYQGIRFLCLPYTSKMGTEGVNYVTSVLDKLLGAINTLSFGGILSIFMMPIIFLPPKDEASWTNVRHGLAFDPPTGFPGYTPKNKKLLTYPYVTINVSNMRDQGVDYAYEHFINRQPSFYYEGILSINPSCICYPVGYKGKAFAVEDGVSLTGYPLATWGQDGLTEWVSNHMFQTALNVGLAAATSGASAYGAAIKDPIGAIKSRNPGMSTERAKTIIDSAPRFTESVTKNHAKEMQHGASQEALVKGGIGVLGQIVSSPPSPAGINAHDLLFGNIYGKRIHIRKKTILTENARRIDDYFTRYGYATNELKVPNIKSRPFWNYVQLQAPHFDSINCPMDALNTIASVYEKGVTFWRPTSAVGDYTNQDNSV